MVARLVFATRSIGFGDEKGAFVPIHIRYDDKFGHE